MRAPRILDAWEKAVDAFAFSSWSSLGVLLFTLVWIGAEAARGKPIGFDGVLTILALEVALSTRRWQGRETSRPPKTTGPDGPAGETDGRL